MSYSYTDLFKTDSNLTPVKVLCHFSQVFVLDVTVYLLLCLLVYYFSCTHS